MRFIFINIIKNYARKRLCKIYKKERKTTWKSIWDWRKINRVKSRPELLILKDYHFIHEMVHHRKNQRYCRRLMRICIRKRYRTCKDFFGASFSALQGVDLLLERNLPLLWLKFRYSIYFWLDPFVFWLELIYTVNMMDAVSR